MTPKTLTSENLRRMLIFAYQKVSSKKDAINSINMFPVPDQDTGDNLVSTLQGVDNAIENQTFTSINQLRDAAIDGAICNASGNVGIITTGFLNGFLSHFSQNEITPTDFIQAFACGKTSAYESIQNPKEGTILDVIQGASESLQSSTDQTDFKKILKNAIKKAKESLDATKQKMDIYQKTDTVDAGGYGFLLIMEGFLEGLNGKYHHHIEINQKIISKTTSFFQVISHRYEVISLLQSPKKSKEEITAELNPYGDCLDIVQANTKIKIHIHTDLPDDVVEIISKYGTVIHSQTTDMTEQIEENSQNKKTIGLVTDSMSGLDPEFIIKHDIIVVPFKTSWKKVDAQISDPNISVYQKMRLFKNKTKEVGWPKTSQPSPKDYLTAFKEQLQKYNSVICIPTSSSISGSYNCALQAKSFLPSADQNKIFISDLLQVGPGQAILIFKAIQLIKQGYTPQQIENELFSVSQKEIVFAIPENMSWVIKGGRVSGFKAKILYFLKNLNFHPTFYLTPKGVSIMKIYFGHKDVYRLMTRDLKQIAQKTNQNKLPLKVVIQHSCDPSEIEKFKTNLDPELFQILQTSILSPVLGIHVGPGTLSAALLPQKL